MKAESLKLKAWAESLGHAALIDRPSAYSIQLTALGLRILDRPITAKARKTNKLTYWFITKGFASICLVVLLSCGDKRSILPLEFNDPYLNSFRGKNIKYVIMERRDRQSNPDTIELDKAGNVIRIKSWWSTELRSYDSNGFLQRQRERSDITLNYVLRYSLNGDSLQQTWREINSSDWNLDTDTSSSRHHVILFEYDSKGRIGTEIVYGGNLIKYIYVDDLLVKKDAYSSIHPMKFSHGFMYEYDNNSVLQRIVRTFEGQTQEITNLFDGLPDSRISLEDGQYKYRYVYY